MTDNNLLIYRTPINIFSPASYFQHHLEQKETRTRKLPNQIATLSTGYNPSLSLQIRFCHPYLRESYLPRTWNFCFLPTYGEKKGASVVELRNRIREAEKIKKKVEASAFSRSPIGMKPPTEDIYKEVEASTNPPRVFMVSEKANPINSFLRNYSGPSCSKESASSSD